MWLAITLVRNFEPSGPAHAHYEDPPLIKAARALGTGGEGRFYRLELENPASA